METDKLLVSFILRDRKWEKRMKEKLLREKNLPLGSGSDLFS